MPKLKDSFERKLKRISTENIQESISSALSQLLDDEYEVEVKSIDYNHDTMATLLDSTEIKIVVYKKNELE